MNFEYNENFPKAYIFNKMRDKYKTEIRKVENSKLFKLKRLAFQENSQESYVKDQKTNKILCETMQEIQNPINEEKLLEKLTFIRVHTCEQPQNNETILFMIENGLFNQLLDLTKDFVKFSLVLQIEILWIFCNITHLDLRESSFTNVSSLIPFLMSCMQSKEYKIKELAYIILNNLADDNKDFCIAIINSGVLQLFRQIYFERKTINIEIFKNFVCLLHALSKKEFTNEVLFFYYFNSLI